MFVKKSSVNSHDALHPKCPGHNLIAKSSFLKLLPSICKTWEFTQAKGIPIPLPHSLDSFKVWPLSDLFIEDLQFKRINDPA